MRVSLLLQGLAIAGSITNARAAPSAGCTDGLGSVDRLAVGDYTNVTIGDRYYLFYIPVNYNPQEPAPLILSYHGGSRNAEDQLLLDNLTSTTFNKDYLIAYPNGIDETWYGVPNVTTDDLGFTVAIIDKISATYCVDTARIFATGKSQGGGFVGQLACNDTLSQRIAAFAPVSGAFYVSPPDFGDKCVPATVPIPCHPGRADIPLLDFHGGADGTISYEGGARKGGCLPTIPHYVQAWAGFDGLGEANVSRPLGDEGAVVYEWGAAEGKKGLVTHVFDGPDVDHSWPATFSNPDNKLHKDGPASFNATTLILEFFEKYPLP